MDKNPFDAATWAELPSFLERLPTHVTLTLWGDATAGPAEQEANRLCQSLAQEFDMLHFRPLPRRANYPYYPVIGVMGGAGGASSITEPASNETVDYGVRLIGLPAGYQLTSLIAAIQTVSFQAQTLEPLTRIKLRQIEQKHNGDIIIEILTTADDEGGVLVAKHAFGLAVASPRVRTLLIMADAFPEAAVRYSAHHFPHTVINGRFHISGVVDEAGLLAHIHRSHVKSE
jgi:hypothetical protein